MHSLNGVPLDPGPHEEPIDDRKTKQSITPKARTEATIEDSSVIPADELLGPAPEGPQAHNQHMPLLRIATQRLPNLHDESHKPQYSHSLTRYTAVS